MSLVICNLYSHKQQYLKNIISYNKGFQKKKVVMSQTHLNDLHANNLFTILMMILNVFS